MAAAAIEPEPEPSYDVNIPQVRELLRRAVLTLLVVPDPDLRYRLGARNNWPAIIQETRDAYGSAPPKLRAFHPTNRDLSMFLDLLGMLGWYAREWSEETVRIFRAWVLGASMWQLQERCSTNRRRPASPGTVHNRINGMVQAIALEFREQLFIYVLDELHELQQKGCLTGEATEADARTMPSTTNLAWSAPAEKPLSAREQRKARKELERQLERNQSRARRREEQRKRSAK